MDTQIGVGFCGYGFTSGACLQKYTSLRFSVFPAHMTYADPTMGNDGS